MPVPSNFVIPTIGDPTGSSGVLKAVSGASGTQTIKFFIGQEYDGNASKEADMEVFRPVEMVCFKNDPLSEYHCRVKDMTQEQRLKAGALYERFKSQKESTDTPIEAWEQINEAEKVSLLRQDYVTVEQVASFEDHEVYRLGIDGKNLRDKARRHVKGKNHVKEQQFSDEMKAILEENRKLKSEMEEAHSRYLAEQAKLGKKEKTAKVEAPKEEITL